MKEKEEACHSDPEANPHEQSPGRGCSWFSMCPNLLNAKKSEEPRDLYTAEWARLRGRLDDLLKKLRRHYLFVPTSCRAPYVLDALFGTFADLTSQTARLYEEISCLDKDDG